MRVVALARSEDGGRPPGPAAERPRHLRPVGPAGAPASGRYRVLIADDNDAIRLMVSVLLSIEPDFEVVGEAADGRAALELAERGGADLLILDLAMPELDGLEVLERLRASGNGPRVAVYSGHAADDSEAAVRELGAVDFILKGTPPDELVARLRRAAAGEP